MTEKVENGSRNHEVVPTPLIAQLSGLRANSGVQKSISTLAKANLIAKVKNSKYDGYRLTYGGLDYLSLHALLKQSTLYSVGNQIGVGKESDIFVVADSKGTQHVLKIHRLGRISFRTVKNNRDYGRGRQKTAASSAGSYWMYMSKLAALKEFTFMKRLWEAGVPVPEPRSQNRHTLVMELVDGFPLRQIRTVPDPRSLYAELMALIVRLAGLGLIHGDFNEFNILIKEVEEGDEAIEEELKQLPKLGVSETDTSVPTTIPPADNVAALKPSTDPVDTSSTVEAPQPANSASPLTTKPISLIPIIIDFPQMISIDHPDAETYFLRDVDCIKRFFERRFRFTSDSPGPTFKDALKAVKSGNRRLDVEAEASGFSGKMAKELERYMREVGAGGDSDEEGESREVLEEDSEEKSEEEEENDQEEGEDLKAEEENERDDTQGDWRQRLKDLDLMEDGSQRQTGQEVQKAKKAASGWVI
ncbi:putative serine threonine-protein kinase rio2 [Phaeomoniella chlamydospora]|uniref:non-specific serine/threonine protein kinase n=1 Tax=Phaeomoniella chlamydospora TaxID=158046 RepID=A0A0G2GPD7_PHACM|nr:putative serine threonine-protein kinase rio2 [Phaeomoniella chlamydospora]